VISACRAAFEHLDVTVEDMVAEGDRVAARFTARGIHIGDFMDLPATGKSITMTGIEIFRIENSKIAPLWGEANLLGLMQQLASFHLWESKDSRFERHLTARTGCSPGSCI
jgi:predicted ester cyclase